MKKNIVNLKKMKLRSKRFSIKRRHMIRKLLKVLKSQAA